MLCGESRSLIEASPSPWCPRLASRLLCGESRSLIEAGSRTQATSRRMFCCSAAKAAASLKRFDGGARHFDARLLCGESRSLIEATCTRMADGNV